MKRGIYDTTTFDVFVTSSFPSTVYSFGHAWFSITKNNKLYTHLNNTRIPLVTCCKKSMLYAFYFLPDLDAYTIAFRLKLFKCIRGLGYHCPSAENNQRKRECHWFPVGKFPVGKLLGYALYLNAYTVGPVSNVETYTRLSNTNILLVRLAMLNNIRV